MRWIALLLALFVGSAGAQVSSSRPLLGDKWTTAPAACAVGQIGFDTDATAGANIYGCTAANTWTAQGGTGTVSTVSFTGGLISIANPTTTPAFTVAGTSGGIPYFSAASTWASSAALTQYGLMIGGGAGATPYTSSGITFGGAAAGTGLYLAVGTATTDVNAQSWTQTWDAAGVTFSALKLNVTDTAQAAASKLIDLQIDSNTLLGFVGKTGSLTLSSVDSAGYGAVNAATGLDMAVGGTVVVRMTSNLGFQTSPTFRYGWHASGPGFGFDTALGRNAAGVVEVNNGTAGTYRDLKVRALYAGASNLIISGTAPTIGAGLCTSPSISANNGTAAFTITVGTSCTGVTTGSLTMPAATAGWQCDFVNVTSPASFVVSQTGGTGTTVTLTNYARTTGLATDFTASEVIRAKCIGY